MIGSRDSSTPALAVILVIPDTYGTMQRTLSHLRSQTAVEQMEIVIVTPSFQQTGLIESELTCFHSWRAVEIDGVMSVNSGFVEGIRHAKAPIVVLVENHAFPDENWAEVLIATHGQSCAAVAPSIRHGNPRTMLSWADFYHTHGEWSHPISSGSARHLPCHSTSYKRSILLAYGSKLDILMESEGVLHRCLRASGHQLRIASETGSTHLHFTTWSSWIPARYYLGRQFASTWAYAWSWPRRLLFVVASPLIPWIRMWRIQKNIRSRQPLSFTIRLLPIVFVGLLVEGFGQTMGYAAGAGNLADKLAKYEFHRIE